MPLSCPKKISKFHPYAPSNEFYLGAKMFHTIGLLCRTFGADLRTSATRDVISGQFSCIGDTVLRNCVCDSLCRKLSHKRFGPEGPIYLGSSVKECRASRDRFEFTLCCLAQCMIERMIPNEMQHVYP